MRKPTTSLDPTPVEHNSHQIVVPRRWRQQHSDRQCRRRYLERRCGYRHHGLLQRDVRRDGITGQEAAGDTYSSIEGLGGSAFNDTLTGDGGNNVLEAVWARTCSMAARAAIRHPISTLAASRLSALPYPAHRTPAGGHQYAERVRDLTGSAHADSLTGDGGANTLLGGAGNDALDGGAGADTMEGSSATTATRSTTHWTRC